MMILVNNKCCCVFAPDSAIGPTCLSPRVTRGKKLFITGFMLPIFYELTLNTIHLVVFVRISILFLFISQNSGWCHLDNFSSCTHNWFNQLLNCRMRQKRCYVKPPRPTNAILSQMITLFKVIHSVEATSFSCPWVEILHGCLKKDKTLLLIKWITPPATSKQQLLGKVESPSGHDDSLFAWKECGHVFAYRQA